MLFLVWYDPDTQRPIGDKIQAAVVAYGRRFSLTPNLVLINDAATATMAGVEVRSVRTVQPDHFWVGHATASGEISSLEGDGRIGS
jgi:hypothetical protein